MFCGFYFWATGFLCGFSRRNLSLHFCGENVPRKIILQEIPDKNPPKFKQENPRHISAEGPDQLLFGLVGFLGGSPLHERIQTVLGATHFEIADLDVGLRSEQPAT